MVADLVAQDDASAVAYAWATRSFPFRAGKYGVPLPTAVAQFSSFVGFDATRVAVSSDGIGTKIEVAERLGRYDTLGFDLCAMVVDDLAANGVEPVALTNTLDVDRLDARVVDELMRGLHEAARVASVAVVGGEIAELGARVGGWGSGMHANWGATALGALRPGWDVVDGAGLAPGDAIVAVESTSFRSNGYSELRRILGEHHGPSWHDVIFAGRTFGDWLLEPCRIYAPLVVALREAGLAPKGFAHVTGGGIPNKLGRTLRTAGLGARLDGLFEPTPAMVEIRRLGGLSLETAYRRWNMGNGFLVLAAAERAAAIAAFATDRGYRARVAGSVIAERVIDIRTDGGPVGFPLS